MKDAFKVLLIAVSILVCYQSYKLRQATERGTERTNELIRECREVERRQDDLRRQREEQELLNRAVTHVLVGRGLVVNETMLEENSWSPKKE